MLKGNIHVTNVMLYVTAADVADACKRAVDDAAEGEGLYSQLESSVVGTPLKRIMMH